MVYWAFEEAKAVAKEWRENEERLRAAMEEKKKNQQMQNTYDDE